MLSLQTTEAIQSTECSEFSSFVVGCTHFCATLISVKLKNLNHLSYIITFLFQLSVQML